MRREPIKGGDLGDFTIPVRGRTWYFKLGLQFGPDPRTKRGMLRSANWPQYVWDAVQAWIDQGKQVDDGGLCVWLGNQR